jgi:hypothetical protein
MSDTPDYIAIAETHGASFMRALDGRWFAYDADGIRIVRNALSKIEAARLFCEDGALVPLTNDAILARIFAEYAPYDTMPEFQEGYRAYQLDGPHRLNPHGSSAAGQAWDRGANAAMLYRRALSLLDNPPKDIDKVQPGWLAQLLRTGRAG